MTFETPGGKSYLKHLLSLNPGAETLEAIRRVLAADGSPTLEEVAAELGVSLGSDSDD